MNDDIFDPKYGSERDPSVQFPYPEREFWEALREVFEHYLTWEYRLFWLKPRLLRPPYEVFQSLNYLHIWLIDASKAGMFDEDAKK